MASIIYYHIGNIIYTVVRSLVKWGAPNQSRSCAHRGNDRCHPMDGNDDCCPTITTVGAANPHMCGLTADSYPLTCIELMVWRQRSCLVKTQIDT